MTYLSHLFIRQTLRILLNEKITEFTHFKPKQLWDLMLKVNFRRNLSYFALLIMFMEGLYSGNDFRILFLSFYCLVVVSVVVSGFVALLLFYMFIVCVLILCGLFRCYFLRLLGIPIIYVRDVCIPFCVSFNICNFSISLL